MTAAGRACQGQAGDFDGVVSARLSGRDFDIQDNFSPDHEVREFLRAGAGGLHLASDSAGTKDRDAVGEGHHVVELVGDEDDGLAFGAELGEVGEEVVRLLRGEDGGGLVQDQDVRLAIEELQDFDALLHANGKLFDGPVPFDRQAVLAGQGFQAGAGAGAIDHAPAERFGAEQDVIQRGVRAQPT